jgi:hypothetical protein
VKHQASNIKHQRSPKAQYSKGVGPNVKVWSLEFGAPLKFGIWSLPVLRPLIAA